MVDAAAETGWARRLDGLAGWRAQALAFGAGAVTTLAHAPFHVYPAMLVGFTLLVWLLDGAWRREKRLQAAFARGWSFAFGYFLTGLYWVGSAFLQVEGAAVLMPFAVAALPAGLALFWGFAAMAMMRLWTPDARRIAVFAAVLTTAEALRGVIFTGFPWHLPGSIWPAGEPVSQTASVIGIYGLSLLTALIAAAPATAADARAGFALRAGPPLVAALAVGLLFGLGAQRLERAVTAPLGPVVRVADPGFTQKEKWTVGPVRVIERYLELTGPAAEARSDIVIWPEGAVPTYADGPDFVEWPEAMAALGDVLGDRVLVVGALRREPIKDGVTAFNSAYVLDSVAGRVRIGEVYDKHHLVPFGEYLPFWELYSSVPLAPLQQIGKGFTPGPAPTRRVIPGAGAAVILICYESIFSGMAPRGEERADWIINVTNDAWFGGLTGPWQHYNMARYRAIEEGLPLARAASGGASAVVDAYGRPVVDTGLQGGAVEAPLPPKLEPTIFARTGGWLFGLLLALTYALRLAPIGQGRRAAR